MKKIIPATPIPSAAEALALMKLAQGLDSEIDHRFSLIQVLLRHGEHKQALEQLKRLKKRIPSERTDVVVALVKTALHLDPQLALMESEQLVQADTGIPNRLLYAEALEANERNERAERVLVDLLCDASDNPEVTAQMSAFKMRRGRPEIALEWIEKTLARIPDHTWAHSFRYGLLMKLGRRDEAQSDYPLDSSILCVENFLETSLCDAAAREILRTKHLIRNDRVSTTGGRHTCELAESRASEGISCVLRQIREEVGSFLAELPQLESEVQQFYLQAWAVMLGKQAYQDVHIHPSGLYSGVVYLLIPNQEGDAGALEFGRPSSIFGDIDCKTLLIHPKQGQLVIFPSHLCHRTIPTSSSEQRVSLAFDLCRVD